MWLSTYSPYKAEEQEITIELMEAQQQTHNDIATTLFLLLVFSCCAPGMVI